MTDLRRPRGLPLCHDWLGGLNSPKSHPHTWNPGVVDPQLPRNLEQGVCFSCCAGTPPERAVFFRAMSHQFTWWEARRPMCYVCSQLCVPRIFTSYIPHFRMLWPRSSGSGLLGFCINFHALWMWHILALQWFKNKACFEPDPNKAWDLAVEVMLGLLMFVFLIFVWLFVGSVRIPFFAIWFFIIFISYKIRSVNKFLDSILINLNNFNFQGHTCLLGIILSHSRTNCNLL